MSGVAESHPPTPLPALEAVRDKWSSVLIEPAGKGALSVRCSRIGSRARLGHTVGQRLPGKPPVGGEQSTVQPPVGRQRWERGRLDAGHALDFLPAFPSPHDEG